MNGKVEWPERQQSVQFAGTCCKKFQYTVTRPAAIPFLQVVVLHVRYNADTSGGYIMPMFQALRMLVEIGLRLTRFRDDRFHNTGPYNLTLRHAVPLSPTIPCPSTSNMPSPALTRRNGSPNKSIYAIRAHLPCGPPLPRSTRRRQQVGFQGEYQLT
jgi:hypothetical protein